MFKIEFIWAGCGPSQNFSSVGEVHRCLLKKFGGDMRYVTIEGSVVSFAKEPSEEIFKRVAKVFHAPWAFVARSPIAVVSVR